MKFGKKTIAGLTAGAVLAGGLAMAAPKPAEAAIPWWASQAFRIIAMAGLGYAADYWFDRTPTVDDNVNATTSSSGTVYFNGKYDSHYGASAKKTVLTASSTDEMDLWAQTAMLNWPGSISILVTDTNNNDQVSKSVTHNQHVLYTPKYAGTFTVRFVQNAKEGWDLWTRVWKGYGSFAAEGAPKQFNGEFELTKENGNKKVKAVEINGGIHILPSDEHANSKKQASSALTMSDLLEQTYDKQVKEHVDDFRNFSVGDEIVFQDTIQSVRYDAEKDATWLAFPDGKKETVEWPFAGDLTKRYAAGETLTLNFDVVSYDKQFETIDYLKFGYDNAGQIPVIDQFVK